MVTTITTRISLERILEFLLSFNLNDESKLWLSDKLTESVKIKPSKPVKTEKLSAPERIETPKVLDFSDCIVQRPNENLSKEEKERIFRSLRGAWVGDPDAEMMEKAIK